MTYLKDIISATEFENKRGLLRKLQEEDVGLYERFMEIFVDTMKFDYVSSKNWMGIPIVKLPEDIVVLQEFYFEYKPTAVIEVGVARGGSVSLAVSLQKLNELQPNVLGIDIKMFEHTREALKSFENNGYLELLEVDSTSEIAVEAIRKFSLGHKNVFAILDSNHSHEHVLKELLVMDKSLPIGSVVLVADGIIENLPPRDDRPWGPGNSPLTAVNQFLSENTHWQRLESYSRRSLFSEFRDGWIVKAS